MMYYTQTQETGDAFPYFYRAYTTRGGAERRAHKLMTSNLVAGAVAVCTSMHQSCNYYYRDADGAPYIEEVMDLDTAEVKETKYHD